MDNTFVEIFDKRVSNDKYSKMKLFWFFAALAVAQEYDDMGNKKNKVDKVSVSISLCNV